MRVYANWILLLFDWFYITVRNFLLEAYRIVLCPYFAAMKFNSTVLLYQCSDTCDTLLLYYVDSLRCLIVMGSFYSFIVSSLTPWFHWLTGVYFIDNHFACNNTSKYFMFLFLLFGSALLYNAFCESSIGQHSANLKWDYSDNKRVR